MSITITTFAKLNLFLKVYGKRPDGFHDLISVMQSVSLSDTLDFEETASNGIEIKCNQTGVPLDNKNLVWRAAELLSESTGHPIGGLRITIDKNIPVMGGLAGGSSNGAGALIAINSLWNLELDEAQLFALAPRLGSDVPFCLVGGTALVSGRGERLDLLPVGIADSGFGGFLLVMPPVTVETKSAYDALDKSREKAARKWDQFRDEYGKVRDIWISSINDGNFPILFHNDFEKSVFEMRPELNAIHTHVRNNFGHALMSGSGSTIFVWFDSITDAFSAADSYIPIAGEKILVVSPVRNGVAAN